MMKGYSFYGSFMGVDSYNTAESSSEKLSLTTRPSSVATIECTMSSCALMLV